MSEVKGYKVFRPDWTCDPTDYNPKQYTCPGKFEEEGELDVCGHGMHFCQNAADCFNYYDFDSNNKVAEVIAYGEVLTEGDKSCTDKLEIVREIPWQEVLTIVNTGKDCTGLWNTGSWNTGNRNTGDRNTGDWNSCNQSTGCFCTEQQPIMFFNKPSTWSLEDWYRSEARSLMNQIPKDVVEWIWPDNMTDEEKEQHPEYKTTGGYLKVLDESECGQLWWDGLSDRQKNIIKAIPNFDANIFQQCTGIEVR